MKDLYSGFPALEPSPTLRSMSSTAVGESTRYAFAIREDHEFPPLQKRRRRVCGLRRRVFYPIVTCGLLLVIGLVVGLTVVSTVGQRRPAEEEIDLSTPLYPVMPIPKPPSEIPALDLLPTDPMPRSPLVAAAATDRPSFTLYYQQADGAVQEIFYDSSSGAWRNSSTAFADAKNHTGLAAFDLVDGGEENHFVLYVDSDNAVRAKHKRSSADEWEESTPLRDGRFTAGESATKDGNATVVPLAAVYSADFASGPGARVFFHGQGPVDENDDETAYVQELVWDRRADSWSLGARLTDPVPGSHLAATVDGQVLRLFYCSGNGTIQESRLNMTDTAQGYVPGITKEKALASDDGAITAVAVAGSTLVYFNKGRSGLRELNITGAPDASGAPSVELNPSAIATADADQAMLSVGVAISTSTEGDQRLNVFYSDRVGVEAEGATASIIRHTTRSVSDQRWPTVDTTDEEFRVPIDSGAEPPPP